jgi:16S rRNA (guanine527-N7)-methyltransferase
MEIGSKEWSNFLVDHAKGFEVDVGDNQIRKFTAHAIELVNWTRKINITAITNPAEVASKHFLDSLAPARLIAPHATLLDIGSGGGFPGVPLKVIRSGLSVTLIDASRKKVNFLKHIIRTLKLDKIEARHIRAEELAALPDYAGRFDVIISRALSSLEYFVRLALPLLAEKGLIIALKGEVDKSELDDLRHNVIDKLNSTVPLGQQFTISVERYSVPLLDSSRSIITVS